MPFQHKTLNWFADQPGPSGDLLTRAGPYQTRWYLMDEHTGTHFDAPSHFIPPPGSGLDAAGPAGDITSDKVPVEQLMGPAVVIDVPEDLAGGEPGVSPAITPDHVRGWESKNGDVVEGDVVLFRCGWDRRYVTGPEGDDFVFNVLVTATADGWPAPDPACAEYLLDKGVRCMGTDAPSMGAAEGGALVHRVALARGRCSSRPWPTSTRCPRAAPSSSSCRSRFGKAPVHPAEPSLSCPGHVSRGRARRRRQ